MLGLDESDEGIAIGVSDHERREAGAHADAELFCGLNCTNGGRGGGRQGESAARESGGKEQGARDEAASGEFGRGGHDENYFIWCEEMSQGRRASRGRFDRKSSERASRFLKSVYPECSGSSFTSTV
jgi:hypothetical protein